MGFIRVYLSEGGEVRQTKFKLWAVLPDLWDFGDDGTDEWLDDFLGWAGRRELDDLLAGAKMSTHEQAVLVLYLAEDLRWDSEEAALLAQQLLEPSWSVEQVRAGWSQVSGSEILGTYGGAEA